MASTLAGTRVIELGGFISSPYAGKLLADLGADVIKVESPAGDRARRQGPFPGDRPDPERSGLFLFLNGGKRSVALDLETDAGRETLDRLVESAEIVIDNRELADVERSGIDYAALAARNPGIVFVSITPYGLGTPRDHWLGTALTTTAASGVAFRIGDPDRSPLWLPYCAADFQGGIHAAIAALAALRVRRRDGAGQHGWVAQTEIMGSYLSGSALPAFVLQGQLRPRAGRHMPAFYPWEVAEVADGYFEVITMVDDQWSRFVELMGSPDWAGDERLQNRWLAWEWADELDAYWHPWIKARTKAELSELFAEHRIAFQPVHTIAEVVDSAQLEARGFWVDLDHPVAGRYRTLGPPYRLSGDNVGPQSRAPLLGEHSSEVIAELKDRPGPQIDPARSASSETRLRLPLEGIRVLDHGHVWAGPLLGTTLSELGADVIKILPAGRITGALMGGRGLPGTAGSRADAPANDPVQYHGYDRGKRSATLNLATPEGKELYLQLVAMSDIVVENFSPNVLPSLGLGYEDLRKVNPGIIMASLSAVGATPGPWAERLTYGPSLGALFGIKSLLGYHDDPMPREDAADLDPTAAGHASAAVLAALLRRDVTGEGRHIAMAQSESALQRIAEPIFDYLFNGRVAGTQGNRYPGMAPHGIYRAAGDDSWIAIAVRDEGDWARLLHVAEPGTQALSDRRFATVEGRLTAMDDLDAAMEAWTSGREAMALAEELQAAGVPAHPVMGPPDLAGDENFAALTRAGVTVGPHANLSLDSLYSGVVWKLPRTPGVIQRAVPGTDDDNDHVYGELLGLTAGRRRELRQAGII